MSEPGFDDFAALVGSTFTVSLPGETDAPQTAVLASCERAAAQPGFVSYVLQFTVESTTPPQQGTYYFAGETLGPVAIFVVPTGVVGSQATYEAVFNQTEEGVRWDNRT